MVDEGLVDILLRAIELENREHPHDTLWVTDIAQCLRKTYYQFKYPLKPEYQLRRPLVMGKAIHLWIENLLVRHRGELGIDIRTEVEVMARVEGVVVRGLADIVLDNVLYEIKTARRIPVKPYLEHILQACFYAYVLGMNKYCILYISDNGYREYCMETDNGTINIFRERVKILKQSMENNTPPPREKSPLCSYCPYKRLCSRDKTLF